MPGTSVSTDIPAAGSMSVTRFLSVVSSVHPGRSEKAPDSRYPAGSNPEPSGRLLAQYSQGGTLKCKVLRLRYVAAIHREWFYDICQMTAYRQQQRKFDDWITNAENCGIREFEGCAKTYRAWRKEILNAFKYGLTNGSTEGFNNKIKVLKRSSYGIRNFERFRTRILHCTS